MSMSSAQDFLPLLPTIEIYLKLEPKSSRQGCGRLLANYRPHRHLTTFCLNQKMYHFISTVDFQKCKIIQTSLFWPSNDLSREVRFHDISWVLGAKPLFEMAHFKNFENVPKALLLLCYKDYWNIVLTKSSCPKCCVIECSVHDFETFSVCHTYKSPSTPPCPHIATIKLASDWLCWPWGKEPLLLAHTSDRKSDDLGVLNIKNGRVPIRPPNVIKSS